MVIQRTHELDALNELITAASGSLKLTDVLNTIVEHMRKQWSEQPIGLWMIDEESGLLKPHLMPGVNDDPFARQVVELGKGVLGGVASKGVPLMDNVAGSSQPVANDDTVTPLPRSIACVPLIFQGVTVKGLLAVLGQPGQELSQEDLDLLQSYANHVVTAIDNALLYEQSERERATIRALTESLAQPLLIVNHHGELIIANHMADALLEEILEANIDGKIDQKPALSQVLEAISKSTGQATELTIGERIYVVTVQQKPDVGTIILMQDVTEVRQLERLRVEVAQALSHDIRGPLASIIGYAEFISEPSLPHSDITEISEHILGAAGRMNEMSSHLLDFAMLKESARDKHGPVDFKDAVENAVTDLRGATLAKSVVIDFSVEGEPVPVKGDINRLYRSVLNLIHNALKYSPEKDKILVRLNYHEDAVELTVRDRGPGIPEEELPRIFEKYYRVEKSPRERSGIGLGLAMVRAAVEDYGGTVSARNPKGGGAEFSIRLPRQTG
jgi:signal transduction histidine kinase